MKLSEIENLVEKYYDGETTLSEERTLHRFFSGDNVPAHLEYMKKQFAFLENERGVRPENPNFDDIWLESLEDKGNKKRFRLQRPLVYTAYSAAAAILIAIGINIFSFLSFNNPSVTMQSTIDDPKEAYRETKQALILVSAYINEALTECTDISKFDEYTKIIFGK